MRWRRGGGTGLAPGTRWGVVLVLAAGLLLSGCRRESPLRAATSAEVRHGRGLFQRGQSPQGSPLTGFLGPERVELEGAVAACARCHGPSGRGSREGGVEVPDITPGSLEHSRAVGLEDIEDRARPAYTRATLLRAITEGRSASGRPLGVAMPRYALTEADADALLGYLQTLDAAPDPGLSATTLTVGAALPLKGPLAPVGQEVQAVVRAVFADVNARGGIFRRRLELVVEDDAALYATAASSAGADATARLLERDVFALVASLRPARLASDARLEQEGAPLVLPLPLEPGPPPDEGPVFFLYPEPSALARIAVQHLASTEGPRLRRQPLAVVHPEDAAGRAWWEAVRAEAGRRELATPLDWGPALEETETEPGPAPFAVLYTGTSEGLASLTKTLAARALKVPVFAPAALADPRRPELTGGQVFFLSPMGLGEHAPDLEALTVFMDRHGLKPGHTAFQLGAYAAARVFVEAVTRAGADLTRAGLQQQLESLRDFDTGVSPPVSFGVNRRVGVQGAQLATLEATTGRLRAASDWIPLSP
ncbi:cytochrome c/ABC transporter substrate-binding protein [Corallococcus carmarthensis]|uniref:cytochrome c/ABC transporter substrate-binding protein n=1 Tax=Corallococcus carmarthensis TaxID=2316728 RepID=UPI00148B7376|nr:ABC transporter substrate-binding protein [Corallococcus carmarthensis]NOK19422.1 ABC transporter substrate-binding protein [Corallococcus carmarthensis]